MDTFYSIFQIIAHKCSHWQLANLAGENIPTLKKGHNTKQKDVLFSLGLTAVSYTRYWKQGRLWYSRFCSMKDNLDTYIRLERHWHIAMLYFSVDSPVGQLTTMAQIQIIEGQKYFESTRSLLIPKRILSVRLIIVEFSKQLASESWLPVQLVSLADVNVVQCLGQETGIVHMANDNGYRTQHGNHYKCLHSIHIYWLQTTTTKEKLLLSNLCNASAVCRSILLSQPPWGSVGSL